MQTFNNLDLGPDLLKSIEKMGFEEATPIQEKTIPLALKGHDILGQAQTGTGKTAAFGIPMIERFMTNSDFIQGLVITPTRELAIQVAEELNRLGQSKKIRSVPIYGGQDITRQIRALKKRPQIVVGTPGRLKDHLRRKTICLQNIQCVVLDEADEMLNMGFIDDIDMILSKMPGSHQTFLFSATMPKKIKNLAEKYMSDPCEVKIKAKEVTMPTIAQSYIEASPKRKLEVLLYLMDTECPDLAIIFGRTKRGVDELTDALNQRGYMAEALHGDLTQGRRNHVVQRFREGSVDIMVATDVAARGLDISGVTHVYNYDIPQDAESYVHRIGRTGRAGKQGSAVTLVHPREKSLLRSIENGINRKLQRRHMPSINDARDHQMARIAQSFTKVMEEGSYQQHKEFAHQLLEDHDSTDLVAAAIQMITKVSRQKTQDRPSNRPSNRSMKKGARSKQVKSRKK